MSYFVDLKYINLLSARLEKFKWTRNNVAVCRCPICGDSKKNKNKTRFFFYEQKGKFFVKCHNCSYSTTFPRFLEQTGGVLYNDYTVENLKEKFTLGTTANYKAMEKVMAKIEKPVFKNNQQLENCIAVCDLPEYEAVRNYISSRDIPKKYWDILYGCLNFNDVANQICEGKYPEDCRVVIPFYTRDKKIFAIQGRSLDPNCSLRYITIRDKNYDIPKVYGLERLDDTQRNYCFEGPFDSLFVENGIALAGSSIDLDCLPFDTKHTVFVFDNEPRNQEIVKAMTNVVNKGFSVCVWPSFVSEKDANDMHQAGINVQHVIDNNTHSGLSAHLEITKWKRV